MNREQFEDILQKDLGWRKKELSELFMILKMSDSKDVIIKSMVLLLYAHWEGYIKRSSKLYLRYVAEENIKTKELTLNFHAIKLKEYAHRCIEEDSKNLAQELSFLAAQHKFEEKDFSCKVNVENDMDESIIDTGHNLSSKILKTIIEILGITYNDTMKSRAHYIDAVLLNNRNSIGHAGKMVKCEPADTEVTFEEVCILKDFVVIMLDYYTDLLCDYVDNQFYLMANEENRLCYEVQKEIELQKKLSDLENMRKANQTAI